MNNFYYYYYHVYYCYIVSQQDTPKRDNTPDGKINNQTKSVCNSHVYNNIKYAYIFCIYNIININSYIFQYDPYDYLKVVLTSHVAMWQLVKYVSMLLYFYYNAIFLTRQTLITSLYVPWSLIKTNTKNSSQMHNTSS